MTETAAAPARLPAALKPGNKLYMFILGFASGLPYSIFTGTILAWVTTYGINPKTIGILSWAGLAYAFKFLWSPLVSSFSPPNLLPNLSIGKLRRWMVYPQFVIVLSILVMLNINPAENIALVGLLAVVAAFSSATQDIVIAAWRIRAAETSEELNAITTTEQFGYRLSAFMGGAAVLIYADAVDWQSAWFFVAMIMAACLVATLFLIPDVKDSIGDGEQAQVTLAAGLGANRAKYLWPVLAVWITALIILFGFMAYMLIAENPPSTRNFTLYMGPLIIGSCVGAPVIASILILKKFANPLQETASASSVADNLYIMLLEPMIDLVYRLRYATILILVLVLTYRFADTIWGSFAYPFYLGAADTGGLAHTLSEVAVASKMFGVLMTILGTIIAGFVMAGIGRLPSLVLGGILAAITNLLYADLALGGARIDVFVNFIGLDNLLPAINNFVNWLETTPIIKEDDVVVDARLARLMIVIAGENLAVGFASVVYVVYLSSIVNKRYAGVQYALLASLTMLIGVMGRGYLGELIENQGYAFVFVLTCFLGGVGVLASIAEWIRQSRLPAETPSA